MVPIPGNTDPRQIEKMLNKMFSPEWLRTTAAEIGYVQRNRKIDPVILFWVLVLGFGVGVQRTIASLRRAYETASAESLVPSSFYDRFNLVGAVNQETKEYHLYLTNPSPDQLSADDVALLYRARWSIELAFKELKAPLPAGCHRQWRGGCSNGSGTGGNAHSGGQPPALKPHALAGSREKPPFYPLTLGRDVPCWRIRFDGPCARYRWDQRRSAAALLLLHGGRNRS